MLERHGHYLLASIESLGIEDKKERLKAIENAENIIEKVVDSYEKFIGKGHIGKNARPARKMRSYSGRPVSGLIYGRIQSGKTRAMILSTALAFDNGFRIVVVMTTNINDLVDQTHFDFTRVLTGVAVYTKDDELRAQVEDAAVELGSADGRILIIASKGSTSLKNVTDFLKAINAKSYPILIFDDEGDQASLDNNNRKRSLAEDSSIQKSKINGLIAKLRNELPASIYLSVTGTPQAVLLQTVSSEMRPSFIYMLPPGNGYVGGDFFFDTEQPEQNKYRLISIVAPEDKARFLNPRLPISEGLKESILFFLLSASTAIEDLGFPTKPNEKDKGYQFLCHPSLKNNEQEVAARRILAFLTEVKKVLLNGGPDTLSIGPILEKQYEELKARSGRHLPSLAVLKKTMLDELKLRNVLTINASNSKRKGIEYRPGINFLVGGNTLGRGIAIPNLLVTYYVRTAVNSQLDTMHQHARMFGYRTNTLAYTKLFTTRNLYYRFRDIHNSDKELRNFIERHLNDRIDTFPVELSRGLKTTRAGVLEVDNIETIRPGMQIYPNRIKLPQSPKTYTDVMEKVGRYLKADVGSPRSLQSSGKAGVVISKNKAIEIVELIKTKSDNAWSDKTIKSVIDKLCQRLKSPILLKFRNAERKVEEEGTLSSGTISGREQDDGRALSMPTLWIMSVTASKDSLEGAGTVFTFPTVIVPDSLPKVFVFSRK
jgi:Z1 domain